MSEAVGSVRVLHQDREVFLGWDYLTSGDVSQPTLEQLGGEVRRLRSESAVSLTSASA